MYYIHHTVSRARRGRETPSRRRRRPRDSRVYTLSVPTVPLYTYIHLSLPTRSQRRSRASERSHTRTRDIILTARLLRCNLWHGLRRLLHRTDLARCSCSRQSNLACRRAHHLLSFSTNPPAARVIFPTFPRARVCVKWAMLPGPREDAAAAMRRLQRDQERAAAALSRHGMQQIEARASNNWCRRNSQRGQAH